MAVISTDSFTRLQDIERYNVQYKPQHGKPALWDCPAVIRDAANGVPPKVSRFELSSFLKYGWPLFLGFAIALASLWERFLPLFPFRFYALTAVVFAAFLFFAVVQAPKEYSRDKALFDRFAAQPDIFRDEIFKLAVARLQVLDFFGRHVPVDKAAIGNHERDVIEGLRRMGIQQETTVRNRGVPFLIHQYELRELGWGRWEDGGTKNYTADIAILWPERRIKFDIEVDDPSPKEGTRPLRDIERDKVLTERGWFVRRLNQNFLRDEAKAAQALREIVGIVYFFAKYANDEPLDNWLHRYGAWVQGRLFVEERRTARKQRQAGSLSALH